MERTTGSLNGLFPNVMAMLPINPQIAEPLKAFVGDVGGARGEGQGIFKATNRILGADFFLGLFARGSAAIVLLMLVALVFVLARSAMPAIRAFGFSFFTNTEWRPNVREINKLDSKGNILYEKDPDPYTGDPVPQTEKLPASFGAAPMIYGTVVSSLLALLIAVPLSFGSSLFLVRIGTWLSPTFIKSGVAGLLLTALLAAMASSSVPWVTVATCVGLGLTVLLLWVAWRTEDPRVGSRRELAVPIYAAIALCTFFIGAKVFAASYHAAAIAAVIAPLAVHALAPSFVGIVSFLIEFLAAIPSIAYGIWGVLVLGPFLQDHIEPPLNRFFGFVPFLRFLHTDTSPNGHDMLCAGMILGIMILPIITAISRDVLRAVPRIQIEGTQALGATWWQSSWAMLRYSRSGLFGAVILGLARAAGETMAVAMVIGNEKRIRSSILEPAQTMSGLLANEFREADGMQLAALTEIGLILLLMSLAFNVAARYFVVGVKSKGAAA